MNNNAIQSPLISASSRSNRLFSPEFYGLPPLKIVIRQSARKNSLYLPENASEMRFDKQLGRTKFPMASRAVFDAAKAA